MKGKCALCQSERELQYSHYMPKSIFRIISRGHEPHDNAPVMVDVPRQTSLFTNKQVQKHLLCLSCENMFSKNGENLVIPQCAHDKENFFLLNALKAGIPSDVKRKKIIYNGPKMPPDINGSAYLYFATSIFWRGAVTKWNKSTSDYQSALGPKYQEKFRTYLLGHTEFPKEARVLVFVDYQDQTRGMAYFPSKHREKLYGFNIWQHSFLIPGIRFIMVISNELAAFPDVGTSSECRISFFEWHPINTEFQKNLISIMGDVKAKGKLSQNT